MLLKDRLTDKSYTKQCKAPEWRPFDIPCIIRAMIVRNLELSFASNFSLQKICTLLNYDFDIALSNYDRFFQDDRWCITNRKLSFLLRKRVVHELNQGYLFLVKSVEASGVDTHILDHPQADGSCSGVARSTNLRGQVAENRYMHPSQQIQQRDEQNMKPMSDAATGAEDLRYSEFLRRHPYRYARLTRFYYRQEPFPTP